ncbi:MAG: SDR family NAD(P)-dependent oxidoreductase, partial [Proteobacteria bacterium]|nr:SDR family NAD(P)-dependent oxidoreductase [Pseudomonadota bacterium]
MSAPVRPRTVLVTGAAKRLGREIALLLAAGGWQVAVHYRGSHADATQTVADCINLAGASAAFDADLTDEAAVRALLPRVVAQFGRVDAVVNSASTFEHDSAASFGFAAMEAHWRSNTGAPILLAQALHEHVKARDGGAAPAHPAVRGVVVNLLDQKLWNP